MADDDDAFLAQVEKERDDIAHQMEVISRQIEELCARDDFEKAEQLDVELQTLQHRLDLVLAMSPTLQAEGEGEEDDEPEVGVIDLSRISTVLKSTALAGARASGRFRKSGRVASSDAAGWMEIPLTPEVAPHKPRGPAPGYRPRPPPVPPAVPVLDDQAAALQAALSDRHVLDRVLSFLPAEDLGRLCGVSRFWRERIEQDELWQPLFRPEWQYEVNPSPGTFKRWYGAIRSAALSWRSPILQQECVRHESLMGRVEIRGGGSGGDALLIAMGSACCTVWNYSSLELMHEIVAPGAFAIGGGADDATGVRIVGGDRTTNAWSVWDAQSGAKVFGCVADEGTFSGGWFVVFQRHLVVYRRVTQTLRGYEWNYDAPSAEISPPMPQWEVSGSFTGPKATRHGLLVTDATRGLVRVAFKVCAFVSISLFG